MLGAALLCRGEGDDGQLGTGQDIPVGRHVASAKPVEVAGGLEFGSVSAGDSTTCGVAANASAYCWGYGKGGQLGNGVFNSSTSPALVTGGHSFSYTGSGRLVLPGAPFTCGLTAA